MGLKENMAAFIRAAMEKNQKSLAEFSEELDIGRNSLYAYSKGYGNPTFDTVEHIARKMNVNPVSIILGVVDPSQQEAALQILNTVKYVSELPKEKQQRFMELFTEMMALLNTE